METVPLHIKLT